MQVSPSPGRGEATLGNRREAVRTADGVHYQAPTHYAVLCTRASCKGFQPVLSPYRANWASPANDCLLQVPMPGGFPLSLPFMALGNGYSPIMPPYPPFPSPPPSSMPVVNAQMMDVCRDHDNGGCNRGELCRFAHPGELLPFPLNLLF